MMKNNKTIVFFLLVVLISYNRCFAQTDVAEDLTAENMLLWQRSYGGWPKDTYTEFFDDTKTNPGTAPKKVLISYNIKQTDEQNKLAKDSKDFKDATIDNEHTIKEIRYLLGAYKNTGNKRYLDGAEKGIDYLFTAQFANGGWPMFYPDKRTYKGYLTYNDNAMANVMNLMYDLWHKTNNTGVITEKYIDRAMTAFNKGVNVIVKTQITISGKKTVWCAQHDPVTLMPAKARSYELPSLSGSESVSLVNVLMLIDHPSGEIKEVITAAARWFEETKISGYKVERIKDPSQPKGQDVVVVPAAGSVIGARFYDLDTNKPYFCDRDGIKKNTLAEIGNERRTGYAWYGNWPFKLLHVDYAVWKSKWLN